jgi:hypothetical protein
MHNNKPNLGINNDWLDKSLSKDDLNERSLDLMRKRDMKADEKIMNGGSLFSALKPIRDFETPVGMSGFKRVRGQSISLDSNQDKISPSRIDLIQPGI